MDPQFARDSSLGGQCELTICVREGAFWRLQPRAGSHTRTYRRICALLYHYHRRVRQLRGVRALEEKVDNVLSLQEQVVQKSDRTLEMLNEIEQNQLKMMRHLDQGFEKLNKNINKACASIGNAMQLMLNLQQSDLPILFLCVPASKEVLGFSGGGYNACNWGQCCL